MKIETHNMLPVEAIEEQKGDGPEGFDSFLRRVEAFMIENQFCQKIRKGWLAFGVPGILGIFYLELIPAQTFIKDELWVIVGDIPPAFIYTDECPNAFAALQKYLNELALWIDAVRKDESVEGLLPVDAPPIPKFADMLAQRVTFIGNEIMRDYQQELENNHATI